MVNGWPYGIDAPAARYLFDRFTTRQVEAAGRPDNQGSWQRRALVARSEREFPLEEKSIATAITPLKLAIASSKIRASSGCSIMYCHLLTP
jgi:hypothetical protein